MMNTVFRLLRRISVCFLLFLPATLSLHAWANQQYEMMPSTGKPFSTLTGLGFDKWASIWLIERHITPRQTVMLLPDNGEPSPGTVYFDEPGSAFFRDAERSTYEKLADHFQLQQPFVRAFIDTVHDIEINLWTPDLRPESQQVESAFRALQVRWGRDHVPPHCYREFFDRLAKRYAETQSLANAQQETTELTCWKDALGHALTNEQVLVPQLSIQTLLGHIRSGAKVAYIDVREPEEFAENHIPGAINLTIRDTNPEAVAQLKQYDVVVAYCVKDFRGFEMARKLRNLGILQSVILDPFGIKGWIGSGLPVYKVGQVSEAQASSALQQCVADPNQCPPPARPH